MTSEIQSIYFTHPEWTTTKARQWLKLNNYKPIKRVHKLGSELRYRLTVPEQYKKFRTKKSPNGIHFVLGFK